MIVNKGCRKLEIVQNIAKFFFQFVIHVQIYLFWTCRLKTIENLVPSKLASVKYRGFGLGQILDNHSKTFNL